MNRIFPFLYFYVLSNATERNHSIFWLVSNVPAMGLGYRSETIREVNVVAQMSVSPVALHTNGMLLYKYSAVLA
jgi:hypothetical protein